MALRTSQAALYYSANVPSDWIDWTAFERPFICRDRACADYGHLYQGASKHKNTYKR